ncbi:MAG: RdgB/HAM1 family non-canonical purine NTP pyrophosphatase [Pseudomonadota bacterium]
MDQKTLEPCRLVAATHNAGKVRELIALLQPLGFDVVSVGDLDLPEPDETEFTFEGNALIKARSAVEGSGLPALADDSGLSVDALGGQPGVFTADWAGEPRNWMRAMEKVERELQSIGAADRSAAFHCCLALAWPDGSSRTFMGTVRGELVWPPRGELGFGYDPVFVPVGETLTFGEMDPDKKHGISHRADAFAKLRTALLEPE